MPHSIHSINTPLTLHSLRTCRLCAKLFNDFVGTTVPCPRVEGVDTRAAAPAASNPLPAASTPESCQSDDTAAGLFNSPAPRPPAADGSGRTTPPTVEKAISDPHAASPHRTSVSPIPENFFDDAAWEDVSIAPPPRPHRVARR